MLAMSGSVRQKLLASSSPSYGRSALPMMVGAIARDQPIVVAVEEVEQLLDLQLVQPADVAEATSSM